MKYPCVILMRKEIVIKLCTEDNTT